MLLRKYNRQTSGRTCEPLHAVGFPFFISLRSHGSGRFVIHRAGQTTPPQIVIESNGAVSLTSNTVNGPAPPMWAHTEAIPGVVIRVGNWLIGNRIINTDTAHL